MRTEVHLHASSTHRVVLYPETDAEKKLMEILDDKYVVDLDVTRKQGAYGYGRSDDEIQSVVLTISRRPPEPEPPMFPGAT